MELFHERLTKERKRLGLNQSDFGEAGGVHRTAQAKYESGERSPDAEYLAAISRLGIDIAFLFFGAAEDKKPNMTRGVQEQALLNCYRSASAPGQYAILNCALALNKHFFDEHNSEAITEAAKSEAQLLIQEGKDSVQLAGLVSTKHFGK